MIHVKQYAKGEIIVISKEEVLWKGQKYWDNGVEVKQAPWEYEAHLYDYQLSKLCKMQRELPLMASYPDH